MKRLVMVSVLTALAAPLAAFPALATERTRLTALNPEETSVMNLSGRHQNELAQGLGNPLPEEYRQE